MQPFPASESVALGNFHPAAGNGLRAGRGERCALHGSASPIASLPFVGNRAGAVGGDGAGEIEGLGTGARIGGSIHPGRQAYYGEWHCYAGYGKRYGSGNRCGGTWELRLSNNREIWISNNRKLKFGYLYCLLHCTSLIRSFKNVQSRSGGRYRQASSGSYITYPWSYSYGGGIRDVPA